MSPFGLNAILTTINSAIFLCANLEGVRFLNHLGEPIPTVSEDPSERPDGIAYFVFDATVPPVQTDNRLASLATFTIRFALPLPQHDRSSSTAVNPPPDTDHEPAPSLAELLASAVAASHVSDGENYIDAGARLAQLQQHVDAALLQTPTARRLFPSTAAPGTYTTVSPKIMSVSPASSSEDFFFSVLDDSGEALSVLLVTRSFWRFPLVNFAGSTLPVNMLAPSRRTVVFASTCLLSA
jgi:hypothetical protein